MLRFAMPLFGENMKKELELYLHIPFCVKKCAYCDFLSGPADKEGIACYVEALIREIKANYKFGSDYIVTTVFFGGGTPSMLSGEQMKFILDAIREGFTFREDPEISMEANPGTVTEENLKAYREAGINRISFGLQSANNKELKVLGRIHTYEMFLESFSMARQCGFDNINVDLISAIPNQTLESWEQSLNKVLELQPEHISAYSLIIEEGTPFEKLYGETGPNVDELPAEEIERDIYHYTEKMLEQRGYHRYEISNYAKEGRECKHNLGYWDRKEYLGLGLGASSLINNQRFHNIENLSQYIEYAHDLDKIRCDRELLSEQEQMEEFIFLGLRKIAGISVKEFEDLYGKKIESCYGKNIAKMKAKALLEEVSGHIRLTKQGIDISNYVFAEILY